MFHEVLHDSYGSILPGLPADRFGRPLVPGRLSGPACIKPFYLSLQAAFGACEKHGYKAPAWHRFPFGELPLVSAETGKCHTPKTVLAAVSFSLMISPTRASRRVLPGYPGCLVIISQPLAPIGIVPR